MNAIHKITIQPAVKEQAESIAQLIMTAMTDECCLFFVGENQTLDDFKQAMICLVNDEQSQYSYTNTLNSSKWQRNDLTETLPIWTMKRKKESYM